MNRRTFLSTWVAICTGLAGCADDGSAPEETSSGSEATTGTAITGGSGTTTTTPTETTTRTPTPTYAADPTVVLADESFTPRRLLIRVGETVRWANEDSTSHTVESATFNPEIAADWSYYSADIVPGNAVTYTFDSSGVYEYFCTVHGQETMCGVVLVGDVTYDATLPCDA